MNKSDRTVKRELKALRKLIETSNNHLETRVAQAMEHGVRWARENTVGWGSLESNAKEFAEILRKEMLESRP